MGGRNMSGSGGLSSMSGAPGRAGMPAFIQMLMGGFNPFPGVGQGMGGVPPSGMNATPAPSAMPPMMQTPGYGQDVPQFGRMPPDQLAQYNQQNGTGPVAPPPSPFGRRASSEGMGGLFGRSRGGM